MPRTARLGRDDWAAAALSALTEGGVTAVAVEPIAARLGASKSSFYWLFGNRQDLLDAALQRWERTHTDDVIAQLGAIADPTERMRYLLHHALEAPSGDLALRLVDQAQEPAVRDAIQRVTQRRLAVLEDGFRALGVPGDRARHLAAASYALYLGNAALRRMNANPTDTPAYTQTLLATFSPGQADAAA